jgi:hypothetical protein
MQTQEQEKYLAGNFANGRISQHAHIFRTGPQGSRFSFLSQLLAVFLAPLLAFPPAAFAESRLREERASSSAPSAPPSATSTAAAPASPSIAPEPTPAAPPPPQDASTSGCPAIASARTDDQRHAAERWGDISIAQPKIWQYERVNTYLDGLLRDVEGVSVSDLTQLDPNSQNAGAIKFIQSALELGVQYNQAIGVTNQTAMQTWQAQYQTQQQQIAQYNSNLQQLREQQDSLTKQIVAQSALVTRLQQLQASGTTLTAAQNSALTNANTSLTSLEGALTSVNTAISNAGSAPTLPAAPTLTAPTVSGPASGTTVSSTFSSLSDLIGKLPSGIQSQITSALQSPSYPATKRLDSFITLLYERLAREISALQDDTTRDPNTEAFLLQFDVGLYPASRSKNHMARVEFQLDHQCKGCKIYSVYPGESSYNVANFTGESRRRSFWGNLSFLIGLGVSGAYTRQEDTLHGSLVQSVYTSGFQDTDGDVQRFGWNYGAAPFEMYVTPGIHSTFAILTVPRDTANQLLRDDKLPMDEMKPSCLPVSVQANWSLHNDPFYNRAHFLEGKAATDTNPERPSTVRKNLVISLPGTAGADKLATALTREPRTLHVVSFEYNTIYPTRPASFSPPPSPPIPPGGKAPPNPPASGTSPPASAAPSANLTNNCQLNQCAEVLIGLDQPIDPNLVVTVNGTVLERVRDWRGRATSVLSAPESLSDLTAAPSTRSLTRTAPGILEAEQIGPNTWYALDSHRLLLVISTTVVPNEEFPTIRITDPSKKVVSLPQDLDEGFSEILINGFHFAARTGEQFEGFLRNRYYATPDAVKTDALRGAMAKLKPGGPYPHDTFLPLFLSEPNRKLFWASLGETGNQLLIGFLGDPPEWHRPTDQSIRYNWLPSRTQVILEDRDLDLAWSLSCYPQGDELACDLPMPEIQAAYNIASTGCGNSCPAISISSAKSFVSTLQAWIEQYDPDGVDSFYSPAPASLGLFPIAGLDGFRPWQANLVDSDTVTIGGCQYIQDLSGIPVPQPLPGLIEILGELPYSKKRLLDYTPAAMSKDNCGTFSLDTSHLTRSSVVFRTHAKDQSPDYSNKSPHVLPVSLIRPSFGKPMVEPGDFSRDNYRPMKWTVTIPVVRAYCNDSIRSNEGITPHFQWLAGGMAGGSCAAFPGDWPANIWQSESLSGRVQLQFSITRQQVGSLPANTYLFRESKTTHVATQVATLPSLRHLILPSNLTVVQLSPTQFALKGNNAGAIDQVAMQSGTKVQTFPAASAGDYAIVTLPEATPTKPKPTTPSSPQITSLTPPFGAAKDTVTIKGANLGAKQGKSTVKFDGQEAKVTKWTATSITATVPDAAKTGKVVVTVAGTSSTDTNPLTFTVGPLKGPQVASLAPASGAAGASVTIKGKGFGDKQDKSTLTFDGKPVTATKWSATSITAKVPAGATTKSADFVVTVSDVASNAVTFTIAAAAPTAAKPAAGAAPDAAPVPALDPGTYALLPLFFVGPDPKNYLPIEATDDQGKPLTLTIPAKSPPPTPAAGNPSDSSD